MAIRQRTAAQALLDALKGAHDMAAHLAGLTTTGSQVFSQVDAFSRHMTRAHQALQLMQTRLSNTQIATIVASEMDPAPANLATAYTAARTAALAALDAYGAAPVTGEWVWNATTRLHERASVNWPHSAAFATARDALAPFS